jgi:hypothetical protein
MEFVDVYGLYSVNIPAIIGTLLIIAIVLTVLGMREKSDLFRRTILLKSGLVLFGLTILLTGFLWYANLATMFNPLLVYIQDIFF